MSTIKLVKKNGNDDFQDCKFNSSLQYTSRMIQLFFVIFKSVIDYGSIIYTKIKAKTTTDKFAKLVRINFKS